MFAHYRLHASSGNEAVIPEKFRLTTILQDIMSGRLPIDNVAPLRINGRPRFASELQEILDGAFVEGSARYLDDVHACIFLLYEQHLKPVDAATDTQFHPGLMWLRSEIERAWYAYETRNLSSEDGRSLSRPEEFVASYNAQWSQHRYMTHPFHDYVKAKATYAQVTQLLLTESVCASRYADMVAFSLIGMPRIDALVVEVMDNLADELGCSEDGLSHKTLYARLLEHMNIAVPEHPIESLLPFGWRALRGLNLFMFHSLHRRYYFRMMGSIGAGESTFPFFCQNVFDGITRNGIRDRDALAYHARHATLDTTHGQHWLTRVLLPLRNSLARDASQEILLGLSLQLTVTSEYYDALYEHWLRTPRST